MKIKTELLKNILAKASKGVGNGSVPITQFVTLSLKSNVLRVTTTSINNYLQIIENVVGADEEITIPFDQFSKLVNKTSTTDIELVLKEDHVLAKGNGEYKLRLPLDSSGSKVYINVPSVDKTNIKPIKIKTDDLKTVLTVNKSSADVGADDNCYASYYFDTDDVYTTDSIKLCKNNKKILGNTKPVLLSAKTVELFSVIDKDEIDLYVDGDNYYFETANCIIYAKLMSNISDYQIDVVKSFIGSKFENDCKLSKTELCSILDRMSLFVTSFENNEVNFNFKTSGLNITSKSGNGDETIAYKSSNIQKEASYVIDMTKIKAQLDSLVDDGIKISFGGSSDQSQLSIKIDCGTTTFVCAVV